MVSGLQASDAKDKSNTANTGKIIIACYSLFMACVVVFKIIFATLWIVQFKCKEFCCCCCSDEATIKRMQKKAGFKSQKKVDLEEEEKPIKNANEDEDDDDEVPITGFGKVISPKTSPKTKDDLIAGLRADHDGQKDQMQPLLSNPPQQPPRGILKSVKYVAPKE
jgi:hypothetical protein